MIEFVPGRWGDPRLTPNATQDHLHNTWFTLTHWWPAENIYEAMWEVEEKTG